MKRSYGPFYVAPVTIWIGVFFVIPISIIVYYSFMSKGMTGGVVHEFTLSAYSALNNPTFFKIAFNTLVVAFASTAAMVALALPAAYYMARSKYKNFFLLLIIIPFLTSILIRIFAWTQILGNNGILNNFLISTGFINQHIQFLYNIHAVIIVTVYAYLPFAILPLYSTIEKFDFSLVEAARDLGASKFSAITRVLLPNIRGGITTAVLFTFIPAFGNYAIPRYIGGTDSYMLGQMIADQVRVARNWPLASSISVVLTLLTTIGVLIFMRLNRSSVEAQHEAKVAEKSAYSVSKGTQT